MATPTYDTLHAPDQIRTMFDAIAPRYDLLNHLMCFGVDRFWRRQAVRALEPVDGGRYLDIGCGTGDLCRDIMRMVPTAHVVGIDPSEAMLDVARRKCADVSHGGSVTLRADDICILDEPAASFDGAIAGFSIRNVADRQAAFARLVRVIKPEGRIAILEAVRPRTAVMATIQRVYTQRVVPLMGRMLSNGDAYAYLGRSVQAFPEAASLCAELESAGLRDARARGLWGGAVTLFTARRRREGE